MSSINLKDVGSTSLDKFVKTVQKQFTIYKKNKMEISKYSNFDEYYESYRRNKNTIIDYHKVLELELADYSYYLILIYLMDQKNKPISYYISLSAEKKLSNHTTLLSVRFNNLKEAGKMYDRYKKIFKLKKENLLHEEIKKDIEFNEWDLY